MFNINGSLPKGFATEATLGATNVQLIAANAELDAITSQLSTVNDPFHRDAFDRLRVSSPQGIFDAQFTYDLQPLIYEQIVSGSGATVTHDATNRVALMTFSSTPTGGSSYMQSFAYHRYQPGKSQQILITFNFIEAKANCLKFAAYGDLTNSIEFRMNGLTPQVAILSGTSLGNQIIDQTNWNIDKLNGTGASGATFDVTKIQFLAIDFQALYSGDVRIGFSINGTVIYVHQFIHANSVLHTYIQNATLPIRVGMTCTGTVSTTLKFNCASIISEGGQERASGYEFSRLVSGTAGNNTQAHVLSIRPKATFNSIINRTVIDMLEVSVLVTGANSVIWELCLGQAISGTTTFTDNNATYSAVEYNSAGTISGAPEIIIDSGFVSATNQNKGSYDMTITHRYPICLSAAGAARALGTISLVATGIGGTSAIRASLKWVEVR